VAVGCAKVALWLCESGTLGVRKRHFGDVEVALSGGWMWHNGKPKVALSEWEGSWMMKG